MTSLRIVRPFLLASQPATFRAQRLSSGAKDSSVGAAFQLCSGGAEPVGAGFYFVFFEVVEDVGRRALGGDAFLEGLAGAELEIHDVGAVADRADARGVEGVPEENWGLVADSRLGYDVAGAGDVSGFELLDVHQGGKDLPVGHADELKVLQVDSIVYVTVEVKILVEDLEPLYHRGILQEDASLRSGPCGGGDSTIR